MRKIWNEIFTVRMDRRGSCKRLFKSVEVIIINDYLNAEMGKSWDYIHLQAGELFR